VRARYAGSGAALPFGSGFLNHLNWAHPRPKGRWRETARRRPLFSSYYVRAPSNQDLSTGAGAAPACLATILPSTMTINVGTA
jgi:hypothetical protein